MIRNEHHTDASGTRWLIVEAVTLREALDAISTARARGCIAHSVTETTGKVSRTLAVVERVPAGTEEQPGDEACSSGPALGLR